MAGYIPHTEEDKKKMLETIGVGSIDELFADIPQQVRFRGRMHLPSPMSELELVRHMESAAEKNADLSEYVSFLGAGAYDHYLPTVVDHLLQRNEFYTAYTPYQAEISQGVLQSIYEYQTMICELTGLEVANASMYDGASAVAEAAIMAASITSRRGVVASRTVHPETREVLKTYASGLGLKVDEVPYTGGVTDTAQLEELVDKGTACVVVQQPNFFGCLEEIQAAVEVAHARGALLVVSCDPISLALLSPPGDVGADIAVGEGQPLGNPLNFGGPYLGFFATKEKWVRHMPGRLAGATVDNLGQRGYVLTLQTREQHIRRARATSNICSNEALCALAATVYLSALGPRGLREVAELCLQKAHYAHDAITGLEGYQAAFTAPFFKEFVVKTPRPPAQVNKRLLSHRVIGGLDLARFYPELENHLLVCVTEKRTREEIDRLVQLLANLEGSK